MQEIVGHRTLGPTKFVLFVIVVLVMGFLASFESRIMHHPIYAQPSSKDDSTYVMLLNPDCGWDFRDQFDYAMQKSATPYDDYINNDYEVICLGGVGQISDIERYVLPALRHISPSDTFVFVYPASMVMQYNDYIEGEYGTQYRYHALGNADIPKGIAYVSEVPSDVKHELAHLNICGTWHDDMGKDIDQIIDHPKARLLPWCTH